LNADGFIAGTKKARDAQKNLTAEEKQASKDAEDFAKKRGESYRKIGQEILGLVAIFTAGRSLKQFATDITASDAAVGRLAHNLNMSTQDVTAWEGAVERAGGSAAGIDGTLHGLTQQLQQLAITGQSAVVPYFQALGVHISDASGKMRPMSDMLLDLADKFQGLDPARATALGAGIGLDQGTINLLQQGRGAVQQLLDEQRKMGVVSAEDAERAQRLQNSLLDLRQMMTSLGRTILNDVTPYVIGFIHGLDEWLQKNREWLATEISEKIKALGDFLREINWTEVKSGAQQFATDIMRVAEVVDHLIDRLGVMLGLWKSSAPISGIESFLMSTPTEAWEGLKGWAGGKIFGTSKPAGDAPATAAHGAPGGHVEANPSPADAWYKPILDLIGMGEGTDRGRGYNETLGYGKFTKTPDNPTGAVNLTGMTLDQIDKLQKDMLARPDNTLNSSALGRYQIIRTSLLDLREKHGLSGSTLFNEQMQDHLAALLINDGGGANPKTLSRKWASFPDPDSGHSFYGQQTGVTPQQVQDAMRELPPVGAASRAANVNNARTTSNDNSATTQIGSITLNTQAKDARGIMGDIPGLFNAAGWAVLRPLCCIQGAK
jgi:hypothetical protein